MRLETLTPGGKKQRCPQPSPSTPNRIPSNVPMRVPSLELPHPPSGDFNCTGTKSSPKSPAQDVRGERKDGEVTGPGRPLESSYQLSTIRNMEGCPPPGGVADALGGGLQEAKRGGRQAGSGAGRRAEGSRAGRRLLRNCFHKTCSCCKTLCFPKTLFPPFSLTYPFFLFTALFPGGGGQGAPGMEASQARSEWLGRSVRGPRTHKVRQRDPPDHLHPDQRTRK